MWPTLIEPNLRSSLSHTHLHTPCAITLRARTICVLRKALYFMHLFVLIHKTNSDFTIVLSANRYDFKKNFPVSSNCIIAFFLVFCLSHTLFKSLFRKCVGSFCSGHMERERNHYMGPSRGPRSLKGSQTLFWDQDTGQISF